MNNTNKLLIHKYQPLYFSDFYIDNDIINFIKSMILMDNINILLK